MTTEDLEAAERVNAWADRMRAKRQAAKDRIAADQRVVTNETADAGPTYWTTDTVFEESRRVADEELSRRPDPTIVAELLAVLDLRDSADADALTGAYRRLAKQHHPDRFASADAATQQYHAERMLEVNRAYNHLRTILRG